MRVTGEEFCGRRRELAELREYLRSCGRVYIVGERRIGKTSLIFEALRTLRGVRVVYVDLLAVKTVADVTHRLAAAVVKAERKQSGVLSLLRGLALLRPTIGVDPVTNTPTVSFAPGSGDRPETLDAIFSLIEPWRRVAIIFDEFQDILGVAAEEAVIARLRDLIQQQQRASFVFCGSVRHQMEGIFTRDNSPFFKAAMRLFVGPLDRPAFREFLERKFASGQRSLAPNLLDAILDLCHDNPGDVQRFCTALWQVTSSAQAITEAALAGAWEMVFAMHAPEYELVLRNLSAQQAQTLRALAHAGGRTNLSKKFLESTGISLQPSVAKAMSGLISKGIVVKHGTEYHLCDPFLMAWLTRTPA
jgi:hypothetical protein